MANTILTADMITNSSLVYLHNNLRFCRTINREYDDQYAMRGGKNGASLRVRIPPQTVTATGATIGTFSDLTEQNITLTVATQRHVDSNFTSAELTQSIQDFGERIAEPYMSTLASVIDNDAASMWNSVYNMVGVAGTPPSTARVLLDAQTKMTIHGTPFSNRFLGVEPNANAGLVDGLKGLFHAAPQIQENYREGTLANGQLGFKEMYVTQSARNLTTGTHNNAYLINDASFANGDTSFGIDTGTGTITAGEVFTVAGVNWVNPETKQDTGVPVQFVVTAGSAGGAVTISVSPALYATGERQNITAFPADNAAVTFYAAPGAATTYQQSCAYVRDSFVMATADLEMPTGVEMSSRKVMDGISMRFVRQYRIGTDDHPSRWDVLYGYVAGRPQTACRIIG
jgi:hypothetical protein